MITRAEAQQITVSSYNDLCNRHGGTVRGNDTISDIVNVGCHYLLSHYKDIVQTADKDEVYDLVPLNYKYGRSKNYSRGNETMVARFIDSTTY